MLKRILVPLDGSPLAERALTVAHRLAERAGGTLLVIRVPVPVPMTLRSHPFSGPEVLWPQQAHDRGRWEAEEYLAQVAQQLAGSSVPLRTEIIGGDPASVITAVAEQQRTDLIAMSTHGRSGFSRWILGSVAEKVLRSASCPVLVVRSADPFRNILLPLDGSRSSERALPVSLELAQVLEASLTLLHATGSELPVPGLYPQPDRDRTRHHITAPVSSPRAYLERTAALYRRPNCEIKLALHRGSAAEAILDFARENATDLIAMATHGRSGLSHWVYGSVTEKVLRGAETSMLVVPSYRGRGRRRSKLKALSVN